jgi:hypothetical protein
LFKVAGYVEDVVGCAMLVPFLTKLTGAKLTAAGPTVKLISTSILLVELDGVMLALIPVISTIDVEEVENVSDLKVLTTCNTHPVGNVDFGITCVPVNLEPAMLTI